MIELTYKGTNWWGYSVYETSKGNKVVYDGNNFFTLSDPSDIDSDPNRIIDKKYIKIIN